MELSKRLLLLKHIDKFILEQYTSGSSTRDILGMLSYKSTHYNQKINSATGTRKIYIENYAIYLRKRVIDFQYFRKNKDLLYLDDKKLFKLLDLRDRIIFNKIF